MVHHPQANLHETILIHQDTFWQVEMYHVTLSINHRMDLTCRIYIVVSIQSIVCMQSEKRFQSKISFGNFAMNSRLL